MGQFLFYYVRPEPATWVYMSTFLTIGLYFMFSRLWSLRNLDILLLLLLTPGLMMVYEGRKQIVESESAVEVDRASNRNDSEFATSRLSVNGKLVYQTSSSERAQTVPGNTSNQPPQPGSLDASPPGENGSRKSHEANAGDDITDTRNAGDLDSGDAKTSAKPAGWSPINLQYCGYLWLLAVIGLLIIRMLLDTSLVRRPMLSPNLTVGGLAFLGVSLFLFLMANILTSTAEDQAHRGMRLGPGYVVLNKLPDITTVRSGIYADRSEFDFLSQSLPNRTPPNSNSTGPADDSTSQLGKGVTGNEGAAAASIPAANGTTDLTAVERSANDTSLTMSEANNRPSPGTIAARIIAMVSNLIIVGGIIAIGGCHFGNLKTGIGAAVFCTLMPYTAQMSGRIDHVLPAAMLVLAILAYRQPILSGLFVGCAAGLVYFPFFLLPLWMSFYWQRGLKRFCIGLGVSITALAVSTMILADNNAVIELRRMFGLFPIASENLGGVWGLGWHPYFRLPVLVGFGLLSFSFTLWPAQKNLATLLSCTSAIMMAAQFGHGYGGGLFMAWFLPLATLCVFRPNLDDRIAIRKVTLWGKTKTRQLQTDSESESDMSELAQAG